MKPITRKELYLNKIVGNNDYEIPEKPITTEEFFFAEILGEAVQAPEPLTRYQMYLAKIAGRDIEIPYPETRLEYFLAKAAGMDITVPVPITREEIYWSNYIAIVEFEVENVPPLTYKAIEGTLNNYRIYGNTVNGESVGDLVTEGEHAGEYRVPVTVTNGTDTQTTNLYLPEQIKMVGDEAEYIDYAEQTLHRVRKNLFGTELEQGNILSDGTLVDSESRLRTKNYLPCERGEYVLSFSGENIKFGCRYYNSNYNIIGSTTWLTQNNTFNVNLTDARYMKLNFAKNDITSDISPSDITNIQLEKGSMVTDYEPYIENTEVDVTLPALPTLSGTNTLSVGTEVQPSKVYIKGEKEREYT